MRETEFYQKHVKKLKGLVSLERIESSIGSGFPDICGAGAGKQFLIETKVSKMSEGREMLYFERFQLSFFQKRARFTFGKGLFVLALINEGKDIALWNATDVVAAPREPYKKWNRVCVDDIADPVCFATKPWVGENFKEPFVKAILRLS